MKQRNVLASEPYAQSRAIILKSRAGKTGPDAMQIILSVAGSLLPELNAANRRGARPGDTDGVLRTPKTRPDL